MSVNDAAACRAQVRSAQAGEVSRQQPSTNMLPSHAMINWAAAAANYVTHVLSAPLTSTGKYKHF